MLIDLRVNSAFLIKLSFNLTSNLKILVIQGSQRELLLIHTAWRFSKVQYILNTSPNINEHDPMKHVFLIFSLLFSCVTTVFAAPIQPLPADQAFQMTATAKNYQMILVNFKIAPNYYLYQKHFRFKVIKPKNIALGDPLFPSDTQTLKTSVGTFDVYSNSVTIPIPIIASTEKSLVLQVYYQGCSHAGYCYPPMTKIVPIDLTGNFMQPATGLKIDVMPEAQQTTQPITHNKFDVLFHEHSLFLLIIGFLGFGILLSLTPCVLPMIPILSSMIVGKDKMTHAHAFLLSLFYVLGMAITYAIAGILFGFLGSNIQVIFQQPWIIICFSILFVVMALSLFGLFNLQLPEKLRSKIATISHHQKRGTYFGALMMGVLSTLILSPCVTPPLVAVLGFISQTGNALIGGTALFAMGIGMGAPLLLIGALGPKILPKSGAWMDTVKNIMGLFLLAVAIFMLQRVVPGRVIMMLWACLSFGTALYLGALSTAKTPWMIVKKSIGILFFVYGILLIVGSYHGNTNPLDVIKTPADNCEAKTPLVFQKVTSVSDIQTALKAANGKVVMLDFSADWCIACKEMDTLTFHNSTVEKQLARFVLLRADVTSNSVEDQLLERHYGVVAPPTVLFFKGNQEVPNSRIIGYLTTPKFLKHLSSASILH